MDFCLSVGGWVRGGDGGWCGSVTRQIATEGWRERGSLGELMVMVNLLPLLLLLLLQLLGDSFNLDSII